MTDCIKGELLPPLRSGRAGGSASVEVAPLDLHMQPRPQWDADRKKRYAQRRIAQGRNRTLFSPRATSCYEIDGDFEAMGF